MGEPGGLPPDGETYQDAFARMESAVDAGQTDLSGLGFWRLLRRVKVEPMLAEHWADQAGRIDRKAFEARVRFRFPMWFGNLVLLVGVLFGAAATVYGIRYDNPTVSGWAFVVAGATWLVCVHDLAHWSAGRYLVPGLLHQFPSVARVEDRLRLLPSGIPGGAGLDARGRRPGHEGRAVRGPWVLSRRERAGVDRMGPGRHRRLPDHHGHPALEDEERLEAGGAGTGRGSGPSRPSTIATYTEVEPPGSSGQPG
jgi:hypothetical protein